MPDLLIGTGSILVALSAGVAFFVEYFKPSERKLRDNIMECDPQMAEDDAAEMAQNIKRKQRLWFFCPLGLGILLNGIGVILKALN